MVTNNNFIWSKNFVLLLLSNAMLWLAFEMLTPTLPLYVEGMGGSPAQIGLIIGILTIAAMVVRLFTGSLTNFLNKKHILIISMLVCMLATGNYICSTGLILLFIFRVVHGLGFGAATVFYATVAAENLPPKRLGEGMGYFGIGESVCLSIGPVLGIAMLNMFDFKGLFMASAFISLLAALLILALRSKPGQDKGQAKHQSRSISLKIIEKKVLPQSVLMLINGIIFGGVITFIPIFAKQQGISNVAWFFFISAIVGVVVRIVCGKYYDLKGPVFVLVPTGLCLMFGMLLIAFSPSLLVLNIAGVFYGIGQSSVFSALLAWTISMVETENRESAMSSFLNSFDLGAGGGSFLLGFIVQATSYQTMYILLAAMAAAYVLLTVYYAKRQKPLSTAGGVSE
ncbi:MAG: MFS transporter [Peptococcaceae bacterium]|jgi:predicted MFS family arabinose efflux permease|nr:MFS transporter [Peptococcaceae bacterium]